MKSKVKSKKMISLVLIMMMFLLFTTTVCAATNSFNTSLQVNDTQVRRGSNVTVTIGLKNISIESGEKGIGAYTANIKFDSSVLEYVSSNGTDKWEAPLYEDGAITGNTKDAKVVNTQGSIGTITFKVKDDAKIRRNYNFIN